MDETLRSIVRDFLNDTQYLTISEVVISEDDLWIYGVTKTYIIEFERKITDEEMVVLRRILKKLQYNVRIG